MVTSKAGKINTTQNNLQINFFEMACACLLPLRLSNLNDGTLGQYNDFIG